MPQPGPIPIQPLEDAFHVFNQVSAQLATAYQALEGRVTQLNAELAAARGERVKQLAETERLANRLRRLLDALPAGVVVLDGSGAVQECNPVARELLGEPLLGVSWSAVVARAFAPSADGPDITLRDGRRVNVSTNPLGAEPGQILLLQDVTETHALQERLNRAQRLSTLGEMSARLAHQVRTPLASALLYTSHLNRSDLAPADVARVAEKIRARLRHLDHLVNDMLTFARGGAGGSEAISLDALLADFRQVLEPLTIAAGCTLEVRDEAPGCQLYGNRDALLGALQNLATNAMQACGAGGRLRLFACIKDAACVEFRLADNGPGVPAELRERIFDPFFTTRAQGTGLGLAVVQAVARAHQGGVWLESRPGEGATFGIVLPARLPATREIANARRVAGAAG